MVTVTKLIRLPKPLADALKKGAYRKETSQHQLAVDALATHLDQLGDKDVSALVHQHWDEEAIRQDVARAEEGNPES